MINKLLGKCPVCGEKMIVKELYCNHCDTSVKGNFNLSKFDYLTEDEQKFVFVFIKNAGNITQIEKELNISYPTVKKYLDMIIKDLGLNIISSDDKISKNDILTKLRNNEITFEQAEELLKEVRE